MRVGVRVRVEVEAEVDMNMQGNRVARAVPRNVTCLALGNVRGCIFYDVAL